jgi:hypothetical protein
VPAIITTTSTAKTAIIRTITTGPDRWQRQRWTLIKKRTRKGVDIVSEHISGTQLVREMCQTFRETAETTQFEVVKEKLTSTANTLEPMATKLYFKTQKGTEDMEEMTKQFEDLKGKLAACQEAGAAQAFCTPFYDKLEKIIKHVQTMKVRMT